MKTLTLLRGISDEQGTIGQIAGLYTLELPWLDNINGKSCIPTGTYKVVWSLSPRLHKYTYAIIDVPGRAGIRIHGGNLAGSVPKYISHSLGCPLMGMRVGQINGQRAVLASQIALRKFENMMDRKNFILEIKNA